MVAGPESKLRLKLANLVVTTMIPAIEQAARKQAATQFAGVYSSSCSSANMSLTLAIDDGLGLNVERFTIDGQDIFKSFAQIVTGTKQQLHPIDPTVSHGPTQHPDHTLEQFRPSKRR